MKNNDYKFDSHTDKQIVYVIDGKYLTNFEATKYLHDNYGISIMAAKHYMWELPEKNN